MMKHLIILLIIILTALSFSSINAQDKPSKVYPAKDMFAKGSKVITTYIEFYNSKDSDRDISLIQLNAEAGYYFLRGLSINGSLYLLFSNGHRIPDDVQPQVELNANAFGGGFSGFLRWDVLRFFSHSLFVDAGVGMVFTSKDFPPGGTCWNFTKRYGLGVTIGVNENTKVIVGWRDMHISNGKGFGHPKNPSYDSNGPYLGLRFRL
jgi:hypothetical protein